jgi:transcriptional regulator with XRE-family HTH domain
MTNADHRIKCKHNHIGDNVRFYRDKAGLTQTQLGKELGWAQPTVNVFENGGRTHILGAQAETIARTLSITVDLLLNLREPKSTRVIADETTPSTLKVESYRIGSGDSREAIIDSVLAQNYPGEYQNELKNADELCITGTNLRRIVSYAYLTCIEEILARNGVVKVLMHHPKYDACRYAMLQDRGPGSDLRAYKKLVKENLGAFCRIRAMPKIGKNLQIRTIDYMLAFGLDMIDPDDKSKGAIYVRFYPLPKMSEGLEDRPIIKLKHIDGQWYRFFREQFERHWLAKANGGLAEDVPRD